MVIIDGDDPLIFSDLIIKQISLFKNTSMIVFIITVKMLVLVVFLKTSALKK